MSNVVYLTKEGMDNLKKELHFLKTTERARIVQAIADARAQGDLSENAEYDAAKDAQGLLEAKIAQMEGTVASARLLDESQIDTSKAYILSTVHVKNLKVNKVFQYTLVSAREADFKKGKISIDSPIGKALLGKEVGDVVSVKAPAGTIKLEIQKIERLM
ncbi:MAG: transcription elongation factor GreA [Bacteroidota bacterium]